MSGGAWTSIVLAGNRPGEHSFAAAHGVAVKALIPIAGEPMLGRVVSTLVACPSIGRVLVLAQQPDLLLSGQLSWLRNEASVRFAESGDGISRSVAAYAGSEQAPYPLLVTTADHPLLTPLMIETFIAGSAGADIALGLVERRSLEASHPQSRRTWLRFSDGDYSGANLFVLRTTAAQAGLELWSTVERDRKKVIRLLLRFGPILALRALTRTISLDAAVERIAGRLGLKAKAVRLPFAEAAMDVDKPSDLALAEAIMASRAAQPG